MKRILVRGPNWIGDHVMAQPFFRGLRNLYPVDHITLVSRVVASELSFRTWDEFVPLKELGSGRYDIGITLPSSVSAALHLFRLGIPVRVGFAETVASLFLTDSIRFRGREDRRHKSEQYGDLLRWLGGHPITEKTAFLGRSQNIVVAPEASIALREWPFFPELLVALNQRYPSHRLVLVGQRRDSVTVYGRLKIHFEDRLGRTQLHELESEIANAALVVANDSGVAHLAASFNRPCVALFGPGDPLYVGPQGDGVMIVRDSALPCSPCESARCRAPYGYQRCLRNVSVQVVLEHIDALLTPNTARRV